ncbi:hypothetical protein V8C43DRAFT_134218 [Trichoderma afarasin]
MSLILYVFFLMAPISGTAHIRCKYMVTQEAGNESYRLKRNYNTKVKIKIDCECRMLLVIRSRR